LCRRIVLIDKGKIIYDGDIDHIKSQYGTFRTLVVRFAAPVERPYVEGAHLTSTEGTTARFRFDRNRERADALIRRVTEHYEITDVSLEEPDLESIIRRIYVEGYDEHYEAIPDDTGAIV